MNARLRSLCLAALLPLVLSPAASAQAPTPGVKWKTTMSMEMGGMKMPGMSTEVCAPKDATPEPEPQKDCTVSNRKRVGTTESFDMVCAGKNPMTAHMEMTQESPSRWRGKMVTKSKDGDMTMSYVGEKQPGECDASEMERKMNQMKAQGDAMVAKQCLESAKAGQSIVFLGQTATCKDTASVNAYCSFARTSGGYNTLAREQRMGARVYKGAEAARYKTVLADTGKLCNFSPETTRTQYCSTAQKKEDWTFFAEECQGLAKRLAQAHCAHRDFTTPVDPPFVKFCGAWSAGGASTGGGGGAAGGAMAGTAGRADGGAAAGGAAGNETVNVGEGEDPQVVKQKASPANAAKDAVLKSKEALKGLFGR